MGATVGAAVAVLALSGCELASVEVAVPDDQVVLEAYLRPDQARQEAFLYATLPGRNGSLRVDGADVRIRDEAGNELTFYPSFNPTAGQECAYYTQFREGQGGSCYTSIPLVDLVRPGETYELDVTLADGRTLTARTTVPGEFEIRRPDASACVLGPGRSYPITWSRSPGSWAYQTVASFVNLEPGLTAMGIPNPPNELQLVGLAVGSADTTIVFPDEFGVFDRYTVERDLLLALLQGLPAGAGADVIVAAGDRNYVNWVRGGSFNPSGQVRIPSVDGDGTGVFGSLLVKRRYFAADDTEGGIPDCQ
jgi:hypothetical protein